MKLIYHPYRLPFKQSFRTSACSFDHRSGVFLELQAKGHTFWSEIAPLPGFSYEDIDDVYFWLDQNGRGVEQELHLNKNMDEADILAKAPPSVQFGISTLFHSLRAWCEQKPLFQYLNPEAQRGMPVNATLGFDTPEKAAQKVKDLHRKGFRTFKLKVGKDIHAECDLIQHIKKNFPEVNIRLDANRAWDFRQAIENLKLLEHFAPEYCEEPLSNPDPESLAQLRDNTEIPLAADESVRSPNDVQKLISQKSVDVLILKPMLLGSVTIIREITELAASHHIPCIFTSTLDAGIVRLLTAHLSAALGSPGYACGVATGSLFRQDVFSDEHFIIDGRLQLGTTSEPDRFFESDPRRLNL